MKTGKIISNYILQYYCTSCKDNILHRIVDLHASVKFVSTLSVRQNMTILKQMVPSSSLSNDT